MYDTNDPLAYRMNPDDDEVALDDPELDEAGEVDGIDGDTEDNDLDDEDDDEDAEDDDAVEELDPDGLSASIPDLDDDDEDETA
jgi:hypothetical protein